MTNSLVNAKQVVSMQLSDTYTANAYATKRDELVITLTKDVNPSLQVKHTKIFEIYNTNSLIAFHNSLLKDVELSNFKVTALLNTLYQNFAELQGIQKLATTYSFRPKKLMYNGAVIKLTDNLALIQYNKHSQTSSEPTPIFLFQSFGTPVERANLTTSVRQMLRPSEKELEEVKAILVEPINPL